jgi:hypothetical protein
MQFGLWKANNSNCFFYAMKHVWNAMKLTFFYWGVGESQNPCNSSSSLSTIFWSDAGSVEKERVVEKHKH